MIARHRRGSSSSLRLAGDRVRLISPGWSPEQSLTVTARSSSAEGVLVLRVVGEVDLATVGSLREQLHPTCPASTEGWCWIAPRCHS